MQLSKMLIDEAKNISKNDVDKRKDCTDLLISARFGADHLHHILPNKKVTDQIVEDLLAYTSEEFNQSLTKSGDIKEQTVPDEVLFHNRQAFGDILTMTCAIRDFKKQFPKTRIGVNTTAGHIWDNNPYIDHSFRPGSLQSNKATVKIGPGFLTNKSGMWDYHMANAFRMDIENKMGLRITQGEVRPDIWLTEEEYNRKPIIDGPYWIFIYGGEPGWPSKQYHRWQEVINILKDDIKFVQLGVKHHPYPILDNVINYVGKTEDRNTGIRDLFNIFLHAQGSLGLVSMHMHLSAAFNNPSVVVAGGREPASFTQYYGHQYFHNNGALPCVEQKACWACKLEGCKNLVNPSNECTKGHPTIEKIPKCVDIIEPEEIAEGVRKYYKGGRLEYGKKIPNKFFKNIVREKKIFSAPQEPTKVDNSILKKYGFEWGGGSITDKDWVFMEDVIKTYNVKKVIEFGAGLSSLLMSTKVDDIVTFETMEGWIEKISSMSSGNNHIFKWDGKKIDIDIEQFKDVKFDLAFVDGPAGGANRQFSTMYASKLADLVIVHDAGRQWERKWQEMYLSKDFELVSKGGHRCHFWAKKEICQMQRKKEDAEIEARIEGDNRPSFRMITTCRGFGGSERSSIFIMKDMLSRGYRVELIRTGSMSGEYARNIPKDVIIRKWDGMEKPVDLVAFYTSDTIWNYNKPQYLDVMDKLNCKRKVMILNYQLGGAGQVSWTKDWDLYMFLNSTKEGELLKRLNTAKTKVLPPPTDLDDFFKVNIDYKNGLRLIRHNSQRDAKHPEYTNELITQILDEVNSKIQFYYMPARSNTFDHPNIHKFKVNEIPVPEFLSKGNCFWYHLPPGYQDQGPRVIIEAMACGIPCIGDNNYGAKDRITPETGWICNDVSDYIEVLKEINSDISILEKKGKAARERAKNEFVPTKWADNIIGE